jgi:DNA-binding winged helix-turn-helix (wHTH) protein
VVAKDEIMQSVWAGVAVEDANLTVQIADCAASSTAAANAGA